MKGDCLVIMVALTCTFSGSSAKSQHMLVHTAMAACSWRQQQQHDRSRVFAWLMNLGGLSFVAYDYSASDFTFQKHVHGFVRLKTPFWRDIATLPFCCSSSEGREAHCEHRQRASLSNAAVAITELPGLANACQAPIQHAEAHSAKSKATL